VTGGGELRFPRGDGGGSVNRDANERGRGGWEWFRHRPAAATAEQAVVACRQGNSADERHRSRKRVKSIACLSSKLRMASLK
jgi:hypothetical protein